MSRTVTPYARAVVVDWLTEVVDSFKCNESMLLFPDVPPSADAAVLFHGVQLLDAFLSARPDLPLVQLQSVAAAALLISYKIHCVCTPSLTQLATCACVETSELEGHERDVFAETSARVWDRSLVDHLHALVDTQSSKARDRALMICERALLHGNSQDEACASRCVEDAKHSVRFRSEAYPQLSTAYARRNLSVPSIHRKRTHVTLS